MAGRAAPESTRRTSTAASGTQWVRLLSCFYFNTGHRLISPVLYQYHRAIILVSGPPTPNRVDARRPMTTQPSESRDQRCPPSTPRPPARSATFIRAHRERLSPLAVGLPPAPAPPHAGPAPRGSRATVRREPDLVHVDRAGPPGVRFRRCARAHRRRVATFARRAGRICSELAAQRDPAEPDPAAAGRARHPAENRRTGRTRPPTCSDRQWNALALEPRSAADLFVGWLDGAHDRNLLATSFTRPEARELVVDWETRARRLVAEFRARHDPPSERCAHARADRFGLSAASEAFARFWASQDVGEREGGRREFNHPVRGRLVYDQITFKPAPPEDRARDSRRRRLKPHRRETGRKARAALGKAAGGEAATSRAEKCHAARPGKTALRRMRRRSTEKRVATRARVLSRSCSRSLLLTQLKAARDARIGEKPLRIIPKSSVR